jgi:predicted transcriptional regulator
MEWEASVSFIDAIRELTSNESRYYHWATMSTPSPTTIKLPATLKKRIASLVKHTGQSVHAFMLEAIAEKAELADKRRLFVEDALDAEREMEASGLAYDAEDVHQYLRERAQGKQPRRPQPKSWRK